MENDDVIKAFTAAKMKSGLQFTDGPLFKQVAKTYGPLDAARDGHRNYYNGNAIATFLKLDPG